MDENKDKSQQENEKTLWDYVTKDVTPLKSKIGDNKKTEQPEKPQVKSKKQIEKSQPYRSEKTRANEIDHQTARRLKRGQIPIEGRLDLHGMTQTQAYDALQRLIPMSYGQKKRCILIITGKGTRRSSDAEYKPGVLKQKVPEWLREPPLQQFILKTQTAHIKDGGEGALYVYLRRQRN